MEYCDAQWQTIMPYDKLLYRIPWKFMVTQNYRLQKKKGELIKENDGKCALEAFSRNSA